MDFLGHRLEQEMIGLHQDNVEKIRCPKAKYRRVPSYTHIRTCVLEVTGKF